MSQEPAEQDGPLPADDARSEKRVAWIGAVPAWTSTDEAVEALAGVRVEHPLRATGPFALHAAPDVVHVAADAVSEVARARASFPSAKLVLELGDVTAAAGAPVQQALDLADLVVVDSAADERSVARLRPALAERIRVVPRPLDLDWHAPEAELLKTRGAPIKRFRRFHRLGPPIFLFVGPYTEAGGLDLALEVAYRLREELEHVRMTAIPLGGTDSAYLDRCEMRALGLGHRGIVEWTTQADEIPFWYATASVVCTPWRRPGNATPARLAAAAGRPLVATDVGGLRGETAGQRDVTLVPPDNVDALVEALRPLLHDLEQADALGAEARARAERELSPAAGARRLAAVWSSLPA